MNQKNVNQAFIATAEALASLDRDEQLKVLELVSVNFGLAAPSGNALEVATTSSTPTSSKTSSTKSSSTTSNTKRSGKRKSTSKRGRSKKKVDISEIAFPSLSSIPGSSRRERQFNIAVLAGYEAKKEGKNSIMVSLVRDLARYYDTLDTNFSNNVKKEDELFTVRGKGKNARLYISEKGEQKAKELHPEEKTGTTSPIMMN